MLYELSFFRLRKKHSGLAPPLVYELQPRLQNKHKPIGCLLHQTGAKTRNTTSVQGTSENSENKDTNKDTAKQKLSLLGLCPNSISEVPSSLAEELHHDALQLVIATLQSMLLFLFR